MTSSFFGVQMALDLPIAHPLRRRLADLVREFRGSTGVPAQRACWTRAAALLGEGVPMAEYGAWDLIREKAEAEYEDWASGLEAMAQWPVADFGAAGTHLLVSVIVLVAAGSNADQTLGEVCDLPEPAWERRATYARLAAVPPMLNLTNVLGSGMYLAPRPDHSGFSREVLTGAGFEYLARIEDG